ncbi:MAG TPA: hypothetical protein VH590_11605, partial [Ktedonobacterales bacterium]
LGLTDDRAMLLFGVMFGVIGHLPGILRRSTNTDEAEDRYRDESFNILEAQEPEVQVGILAHVLVKPEQERRQQGRRSPYQRPPMRPRVSTPIPTPTRAEEQSRWGQTWAEPEESATSTSGPGWHASEPGWRAGGQRASTLPRSDPDEPLPWSK